MRTITITRNLYTFDELSTEAQERAIDFLRPDALAWQDEDVDTVRTIAEQMGWEYNYHSYDGVSYSVDYWLPDGDGDVGELTGKRAMAYIQNNYINSAERPKQYWSRRYGYDRRSRKSKIFHTINDCPFTGYIMDCCFAEGWNDWQKRFRADLTVQDFLDMVAARLGRDWTQDNEYQVSDEGIRNLIEANGYEFLEDGTLA